MELIPKWKDHPLTKQGFVELVPTNWLYKFYGPDVTPQTNLVDGKLVDMETLWNNISEEGLHDPLIIRVGVVNRKFRLESGNHRIQVFKKHGVEHVPATVQIQDECGPHVKNLMTDASHNFDFGDDVNVTNLKIGYMRPSHVFKSLYNQTKQF